ncbi:PAS domain S-box protein [Methanonatronarchaeum sp. AMET-Sl]|uniref:PAS domain S-box protein n=1 Tax=Methanonatronarchaeum sp. AMET-Sl TaxID=3037654 RepID=UPI00244DFDB6|nr:PAS domain S-box protein [Methanonatronarchaeum sp. AMET-Sl]WGI18009.1 PAS domain S-box protein [Methanonatronarchaeum sp. AMET-Sl]
MVDDEPGFLDLAEIYLEREDEGLEVETTSSIEEALELIKKDCFDCVVSDYQMPSMDGIEFLDTLRNEFGMGIPFILFTGKGREEVAMEALNLGADRYLQKGGGPESQFKVLAQAIKQEIGNYRKSKELLKSEERYRRLFETAKDGMIILDAETGEIKDVNPYLLNLLGYEIEELVNKKLWEINPFKDIAENKRKFLKLKKEGHVRYEDLPLQTKDGREISVEFDSTTYLAGNEEVVQCNIRDISNRKEKEKELRIERKRFKEIFNKANDAIYLHELTEDNMPGRFLEVNEVASQMLGYSKEEFLEMSPNKIDAEEEKNKIPKIMKTLAEEENVRFEMKHQAKDGTKIPVEIHSHLFELEGEKKVLSIARDITERKEFEKKLKEYKLAIDGSDDLIAAVDIDYRYLFANQAYREFLAEGRDIAGKHLSDVVSTEIYKKIKPNVDKCLSGETVRYDMKRQKTNESIIKYLNIYYYPLKNEENKVIGVVGILRDITERKRLEDKFKELFINNPEALVYIDTKNNIKDVNKRFMELFGYKKDEIVGKDLDDLIVPSEKKDEGKKLQRKVKSGYFNYETTRKTKEGESIPVSISGFPMKTEIEKGYLGLYKDISNRKQAEEREKFLHSLLRHDVLNKHQIIDGYLDLLENDLDGSSEYLSKAKEASQKSQDIIEKVRTLREVEEEETKQVDLNPLIKEILEEKKSVLKQNSFQVITKYPKDSCKVKAGSLLKELLNNLIENTIKHSKGDKIRINREEKEKEVIFSIEDNGKGINDKEKEKIFEKGYKNQETGGTGLGLYLAKEIIQKYDGRLEVEDSELGGARFNVILEKKM